PGQGTHGGPGAQHHAHAAGTDRLRPGRQGPRRRLGLSAAANLLAVTRTAALYGRPAVRRPPQGVSQAGAHVPEAAALPGVVEDVVLPVQSGHAVVAGSLPAPAATEDRVA